MSKRKPADEHNPVGNSDGAKKPRTEGAAAAAAAEDATGQIRSIEAARERPDLAPRIALHTLKLVDATKASGKSWKQRMQTVVSLLQADADRPNSLLDLSLAPAGDESCVMFQLLRFFHSCTSFPADADGVKADKCAALQIIGENVAPLLRKLLRSFDPATVDAATGNNALHELCRFFYRHKANGWAYRLAELLIVHGVSVHARNKKGRTPLLEFASYCKPKNERACGLQLLLAHGADPNAQDADGSGLLHHLIKRKAEALLDDLFGSRSGISLNFALLNSAGQTAADLAATQLAQQADSGADCPERRIHRLLATQTAMWMKHAQHALSAAPGHADAAAAHSTDSIDAALARAKLTSRIALRTLKLVDAIKKGDCSYVQHMQTVMDLLKADADRPESLLDLSLVPEGDKSCVLFQLLRFFWSSMAGASDADAVKADKCAARNLFINQVLPLQQKLLRSFDPATVDAATGNNALHELCRFFDLQRESYWSHSFAELLLAHGVSVHARNKAGRTPLLEYARTAADDIDSATGLCLLLAHGADFNAQDGDGNGLLHFLVKNKAAALLEDLLDGDAAGVLDTALHNSAGQTAVDLAAVKLAQLAHSAADSSQKRIHRLLMAQTTMWTTLVQPVVLRCLEIALPVTDVAKLALGYIDGSGLPFTAAADPEAESDEQAEPAAAAVAAAQP